MNMSLSFDDAEAQASPFVNASPSSITSSDLPSSISTFTQEDSPMSHTPLPSFRWLSGDPFIHNTPPISPRAYTVLSRPPAVPRMPTKCTSKMDSSRETLCWDSFGFRVKDFTRRFGVDSGWEGTIIEVMSMVRAWKRNESIGHLMKSGWAYETSVILIDSIVGDFLAEVDDQY